MPRGKQQTKGVHRVTRHLELAALMTQRKKLRRQRAEIHEAMTGARAMMADQPNGLVKMRGKKDPELGWVIENIETGEIIAALGSRDNARARVRQINGAPALTFDEAMLLLGFRRTGDEGHVEERFEKVS